MELKGDLAAKLIETNFKEYLEIAPVWLTENTSSESVTTLERLSSLNIEQSTPQGWLYLDPHYQLDKDTQISMTELLTFYNISKESYFPTPKGWVKVPELIKKYFSKLSINVFSGVEI